MHTTTLSGVIVFSHVSHIPPHLHFSLSLFLHSIPDQSNRSRHWYLSVRIVSVRQCLPHEPVLYVLCAHGNVPLVVPVDDQAPEDNR